MFTAVLSTEGKCSLTHTTHPFVGNKESSYVCFAVTSIGGAVVLPTSDLLSKSAHRFDASVGHWLTLHIAVGINNERFCFHIEPS